MNELEPEQIRVRFLHWYAGLTPTQQDWVIQRVLQALLDAAQPPTHTRTPSPAQAEQARIDAAAAQLLDGVDLRGLAHG